MKPPARERGRPLEIRWTRRARRDLGAIGDFIAADDPAAARRWLHRLTAAVERAALFPRSGRLVPELPGRSDLREVIVGGYRVVYLTHRRSIEVLTVFEGHRLLARASASRRGRT